MNCLRSLSFVKKISAKYKKFGLKTIIIHPPEWEFEKNSPNINFASRKYNIDFPIKIDKNFKIIKKLGINFWPAQILIKGGKIVYKHVGEGNYKKLEASIIKNIKIRAKTIFWNEPKYSKFPTVYCGKKKNGRISALNDKLRFGTVYTSRGWAQKDEYLQSLKNNSSLTILTKGRTTNFVANPANNKRIKIKIILNSKAIKWLSVNRPQLYRLIKSKNNRAKELTITTPKNLQVYSFSFQ